jgi:TolB-like protein
MLAVVGVLLVKLRPAVPKPGAGAVKKIVVLPFENLGAPEDAYFASGMAEEITSRLANVQGLGVISRTSAMEYTRRGKTVKEIGNELGVDYVLEGSVRWDRGAGRESRVRITPQLIRVEDDTHVWADRYDRVIADVFAIQSDVAESTVKAMGVTLLPPEQTRLKEISTNDLEAYDLYLRGQELARVSWIANIVRGLADVPGGRGSRPPLRAGPGSPRHECLHILAARRPESGAARQGQGSSRPCGQLRPDLAKPTALS